MKIYFSPSSPYVRKCLVTAHELGLAERVEKLSSNASPIKRDQTIVARNPLGKVPTFFTDDNVVLYDSRVICEYLDSLDGRGRIFPASGSARWTALRQQALGDGLLDAALLARYETALRPAEHRWQAWLDGQMEKISSCIAVIESEAPYGDRFDIGPLTVACALSYLDFRFASFDWRKGNPRVTAWFAQVSQRPSMRNTALADSDAR